MAELLISSLCFDKDNINDGIKEIEPFVKFLHLDIMDGRFVKNKTFGVEIINKLDTKLKIDVHLMVNDINSAIERIGNAYAVNFHYEVCNGFADAVRIIETIKSRGMRAGIAVNPETKVSDIGEILPFANQLLVMSVHPGKGGQKFIPETLDKIRALRKKSGNIIIEVDGGINLSNARKVVDAGADRLVVGSAILMQKDIGSTIENFMKVINQ